jgi:hypothetical protein
MKFEELNKKIAAVEKEANAKKGAIYRECALSNNTVKKGDIVTDQIGSALVKKIKVMFSYGDKMPQCVYEGPALKKDGSLRKDGTIRSAWQCNLIKINGTIIEELKK